MSQWSSLFAEKALGVPKVLGDLLGPCLFAVFMGIGRTIYGIWGAKLNLHRVLALSSVLCVLCYLGASFGTESHNRPAFLRSVRLLHQPDVARRSEHHLCSISKGGTAMFGVLAVCGDIGCSVGPALTGAVSDFVSRFEPLPLPLSQTADQLGLKAGMLSAIVFPLILLLCLVLLKRALQKKKLPG